MEVGSISSGRRRCLVVTPVSSVCRNLVVKFAPPIITENYRRHMLADVEHATGYIYSISSILPQILPMTFLLLMKK